MGTNVQTPPAAPPPPRLTKGGFPKAGGPASCPANIQETKIAFGFSPQTDVATPNLITEMWSLTKVNPALSVVAPVNETNALDIGKGNEFPSQVFPSYQDATVALEKYVSSEFMAWLFCFTTGEATKTEAGTTGFTYVAIPNDPAVTCINLPCFTWDEQIRPQPDSVIDRALIGAVVGDWTLTMSSGPGRANCRVACTLPGTGRAQSPGLTPLPDVTQEHFLNAAGATITINGIDYVLAQSFISLDFRWNNNVRLDTGFYPGSGTENGYAVRGRMEYGVREMTLNFVARAQKGSLEYNNLINQVEGPASFGVQRRADRNRIQPRLPDLDAAHDHAGRREWRRQQYRDGAMRGHDSATARRIAADYAVGDNRERRDLRALMDRQAGDLKRPGFAIEAHQRLAVEARPDVRPEAVLGVHPGGELVMAVALVGDMRCRSEGAAGEIGGGWRLQLGFNLALHFAANLELAARKMVFGKERAPRGGFPVEPRYPGILSRGALRVGNARYAARQRHAAPNQRRNRGKAKECIHWGPRLEKKVNLYIPVLLYPAGVSTTG